MSVRVRFAPSPTGYLHIGGARTALFNWLYARHLGGTFILRIEDTDEARNTQAAVDVILDGLRWMGLDWDEGPLTGDKTGPCKGAHGPYFQSQRMAIYRRYVEQLLSKNLAYEQDGAVKFRMTKEPVLIQDVVVGDVRRELTDREQVDPDFVIVRSDGMPVFHLVNVIDDLEMGMTHVIRGEDHLSNTSKHIMLFRALGAEPPKYAHIPLILNGDGSKMSKRDQGASMTTYMEGGYVPEAVLNYLSLLGWSPKDDTVVMPLEELVSRFDLPQILRHNAKFDMTKLNWFNAEYLRRISVERFQTLVMPYMQKLGMRFDQYPVHYVMAALATVKEKVKFLPEIKDFAAFYFVEEVDYDLEMARKELTDEGKQRLSKLRDGLSALTDFRADPIGALFKQLAGELGVKAGVLVHPARLALTGKGVGPSLYHLIEVLGRDRVTARMDRALGWQG